jgi:hypothetical protein
LVTAVPFFSERPGSCPKTYHPAGIERGTATIKIHETRDNLLAGENISSLSAFKTAGLFR